MNVLVIKAQKRPDRVNLSLYVTESACNFFYACLSGRGAINPSRDKENLSEMWNEK